jgi:hypothetical protein
MCRSDRIPLQVSGEAHGFLWGHISSFPSHCSPSQSVTPTLIEKGNFVKPDLRQHKAPLLTRPRFLRAQQLRTQTESFLGDARSKTKGLSSRPAEFLFASVRPGRERLLDILNRTFLFGFENGTIVHPSGPFATL